MEFKLYTKLQEKLISESLKKPINNDLLHKIRIVTIDVIKEAISFGVIDSNFSFDEISFEFDGTEVKPKNNQTLNIIRKLYDLELESTKITKDTIESVIDNLNNGFDKELFKLKQNELEKYWFFKYDKNQSIERNTYLFYDFLKLYEHHCERWEEHFNGSICIVERLRDKYLYPKINEFISSLKELK